MDRSRSCLYDSALFEGLAEDELDYLAAFTQDKPYRKGETVFLQGEEIRYISFLKSGLLKVYKSSPEQKGQIISIAKPNDCVGLLSVFSNHKYQYSISALEDSVIYFVELSALYHILRNNGAFGIRLLGRISKAADLIINNTFDIHRKNLRGRIAFILREFAYDIYGRDQFELPVSRKEIGELIGMTTENVIRILSEFRRDGLISIQGKSITILNKSLLDTLEKFG